MVEQLLEGIPSHEEKPTPEQESWGAHLWWWQKGVLTVLYLPMVFVASTNINLRKLLYAVPEKAGMPRPRPNADTLDELYSLDALPDLNALAEAQGVAPIGDIQELVADFWPEDESAEDFMTAVRRWRDEGDHQHN